MSQLVFLYTGLDSVLRGVFPLTKEHTQGTRVLEQNQISPGPRFALSLRPLDLLLFPKLQEQPKSSLELTQDGLLPRASGCSGAEGQDLSVVLAGGGLALKQTWTFNQTARRGVFPTPNLPLRPPC